MTEYVISDKEEGLTLYKYASRVLKEAKGGLIYKFLRNKNIELNGRKADSRTILKQGDKVAFFLSDETFGKLLGSADIPKDIPGSAKSGRSYEYQDRSASDKSVAASGFKTERILFEDDDFLFYDKPAGLRTQGDGSGKLSLNDLLLKYTGYDGHSACKPSVCNRLDTNTTGIVLCGKSVRGLQVLNKAVREHRIRKYYRAVLSGRFDTNAYTMPGTDVCHMVSYISPSDNENRVYISDAPKNGYKEIITDLKVIAGNDRITYAEVHLITGRKHQIRAQMSHVGHPVAGDIKYGAGTDMDPSRQMLHSFRIELPEDILDGMTVFAPIPSDMTEYMVRNGIDSMEK